MREVIECIFRISAFSESVHFQNQCIFRIMERRAGEMPALLECALTGHSSRADETAPRIENDSNVSCGCIMRAMKSGARRFIVFI